MAQGVQEAFVSEEMPVSIGQNQREWRQRTVIPHEVGVEEHRGSPCSISVQYGKAMAVFVPDCPHPWE